MNTGYARMNIDKTCSSTVSTCHDQNSS